MWNWHHVDAKEHIDDTWTLVWIMAWCRQARNHYLRQCWPISLSSYGITRRDNMSSLLLLINIQCGASRRSREGELCLLWIHPLMQILPQSLPYHIQNHVMLDRIIAALDCSYVPWQQRHSGIYPDSKDTQIATVTYQFDKFTQHDNFHTV